MSPGYEHNSFHNALSVFLPKSKKGTLNSEKGTKIQDSELNGFLLRKRNKIP